MELVRGIRDNGPFRVSSECALCVRRARDVVCRLSTVIHSELPRFPSFDGQDFDSPAQVVRSVVNRFQLLTAGS